MADVATQKDYRDRDAGLSSAETMASQALEKATTAEQLAMLSRVDFGLVTVAFTALISAVVGPQPITVDVAKAKAGDRVTIFPVTFPAGYAPLGNAYSQADGKITMHVLRPVIAVNPQPVTFTVRAIAYRDLTA